MTSFPASPDILIGSFNGVAADWNQTVSDGMTLEIDVRQWAGVEQLVRVAKQVMRSADLTSNRHHVFHKIRRSSITHVESLCAGAGWLHGGHSDPSITAKHYIVKSAVYDNVPTPESLDRP